MERGEIDEARTDGSDAGEADMVEMGGETTAAATGAAEVGAASGNAANESTDNSRPVGADTMVKVSGETDSREER